MSTKPRENASRTARLADSENLCRPSGSPNSRLPVRCESPLALRLAPGHEGRRYRSREVPVQQSLGGPPRQRRADATEPARADDKVLAAGTIWSSSSVPHGFNGARPSDVTPSAPFSLSHFLTFPLEARMKKAWSQGDGQGGDCPSVWGCDQAVWTKSRRGGEPFHRNGRGDRARAAPNLQWSIMIRLERVSRINSIHFGTPQRPPPRFAQSPESSRAGLIRRPLDARTGRDYGSCIMS